MKLQNILLYILIVAIFSHCHPNETLDNHTWTEVKTEHKPGTYWWWMGSAVDEENLSYNLESLSDIGIGNVHIVPIYGVKGEEDRYIDFLSNKWMNRLSFTVEEAARLDMNVDMSTTTGWPFGGSHVTPQYAASKIEFEIIDMHGNKIDRQFDSHDLEAIIAFSDNNQIADLADKLTQDGTLNWTSPPGVWEIYVLRKRGTEQKVKRAAPGNIGLVLDPFSPGSLDYYLDRYNNAFANNKDIKLRAQYHDSYEYYHANWTDKLFEEFQLKNGYDLQSYLPALLNVNKTNPHIKADYRRTLAELHLEYIEKWSDWSHRHGWVTRNQAHGAPGNLLDLYAASDIPETETFGSRKFKIPGIRYIEANNSTSVPPNPLILKFASSAAHVTGKQLISSETGTWLRDHYKASLSQIKPEIDELFYCGINHVFYHGNAYSPKDAAWPGWIFYASTHFEKENAFWQDFSELNSYVARCQSILQSGKPANDILLYWPVEDIYHAYPDLLIKNMNVHNIDWFEDSEFGKLATDLDEKGYSFDYISDKQLQNVAYENESLTTNGNKYKTILIPKTNHIPLKTWKHLVRLAKDGASIIIHGSLPADVPGFANLEERRSELNKSTSELNFEIVNDTNLKKAKAGKGYFLLGDDIDVALNLTDTREEKFVTEGVNYIRRLHDKGYYYFITNLSDKKLDTWIPLSVKFISAAIYDPRYQNKIGTADVRQRDGHSEIYLQLQPGESCFVKTFTNEKIKGNKWKYIDSSSKPIKLVGEWQVDFIHGNPSLPSSFNSNELKSWTISGDSAAQSFAGTGKYTIKFNLPNISADDWILDLGRVCESARVKLNGHEVGTLWGFPFSIPIGQYALKGENILTIEVTNLSANRLRDLDKRGVDWEKFFFVDILYKDFDASRWPIMDSGLLGPVTLTAVNYIDF